MIHGDVRTSRSLCDRNGQRSKWCGFCTGVTDRFTKLEAFGRSRRDSAHCQPRQTRLRRRHRHRPHSAPTFTSPICDLPSHLCAFPLHPATTRITCTCDLVAHHSLFQGRNTRLHHGGRTHCTFATKPCERWTGWTAGGSCPLHTHHSATHIESEMDARCAANATI